MVSTTVARRALQLLAVAALACTASATASATINVKTPGITFAIIGDWGRIGGEYSDGTLATCKQRAAQYFANPNMAAGDDPEGDSCGGLEQLKVAMLMDQVCAKRKCQFVVNTGDNFYVNGCYADDNMNVNETLRCAHRFVSDWENVYNGPDKKAINNLKWINSLGNHDVLGLKSGVEAQIAYQQKNPNWILPARWFNTDVKAGKTSIRFHVSHTSCLVKGYRKTTSNYYTDEISYCSSTQAVNQQVNFLKQSLATSKADYNIMIGHHPTVSSAGPSYFQVDEIAPTADGWGPLAAMTAKHNPIAWLAAHDHTMAFMYLPEPANSGGSNFTMGFPKTGFYTSGAGSWPQAGDGGHGLNWPFSFTKWTNTDLLNGIAYSGFAIATVDHEKMVVDFYTVQNGETVPLRVTTYKGSYPMVQFAPEGVKAVKLPNLVKMNPFPNAAGMGDEFNGFKKL